MELTIKANSIYELKEKIFDLNKFFSDNHNMNHYVSDSDVNKQMELPFPKEPKRTKPGKKAKEEKGNGHDHNPPEQFTEKLAEKAAEKIVAAATKEQAMEALQHLVSTTNLETAKAVLNKFGALRISDIKEEDYGALIEACKNV